MPGTNQLIEQAVRGNSQAKGIVVNRLLKDIRHIARGLLAKEKFNISVQTNDLVNTWYRRFRWSKFTGGRTGIMKLSRIAMKRILIDRARKRNARPEMVPYQLDAIPKKTDMSLRLLLKNELQKLDRDERAIIRLKIKGYTVDDIAKELDMDRNKVQRTYKASMAHLKSKLRRTT